MILAILAIIGTVMCVGGWIVGLIGLIINGVEDHQRRYLLASSSNPYASLGDRIASVSVAVAVVGLIIILCVSAGWGIIDPTALQLKLN